MGDRNTPIKFGPEWLRNFSQDRATGNTAANQNSGTSGGGGNPGGASGGGTASGSSNTATNVNQSPKVHLAKLRYGREEMLALYDRTSEPPSELKYIDILYQAREKPPLALNSSFEDEMRSGPPGIGLSTGDRFGIGRGGNRTLNQTDGRGRPRFPFVRQPSTRGGTTRHMGSTRMPGFSGGDEEEPVPLRSWSSSSTSTPPNRNSGDLSEWNQNKTFRSTNKRPGTNTNWRQSSRDEGEEWRSADNNRSRPSQQDKWDRDWGDRPTQDKSNQSWSSNRRTWTGDNQNDDLPEWATDGTEACGGTFDSSGAFHGYSNDDTNIPKQESGFSLTRSHTHGSFVRSKTSSGEEGSEEWWDSEKAKKLSPKKFDTSEIKFKKLVTSIPDNNSNTSSNASKEDKQSHKHNIDKKPQDKSDNVSEQPEKDSNTGDSFTQKTIRFAESKTFDALMRSNINIEDANDDRGGNNFQSVMITPNNSLRQKHQNIVASSTNNANKPNILQILKNASTAEREMSKPQTQEEKLVEDIIDMTLDSDYMLPKPQSGNEPLMSSVASNLPTVKSSIGSTLPQMSNPSMQMKLADSMAPNQGLSSNAMSNMQVSGMQASLQSSGMSAGLQSAALQMSSLQGSGLQAQNVQSSGLQNVGITNSALNANLGLPLASPSAALNQSLGIPMPGVPPSILPNSSLQNHNLGGTNLQGSSGIPGYQSNSGLAGNAGLAGMSSSNVGTNSLFMGQNVNNTPSKADLSNHASQFGLQHSSSQGAFSSSVYDYGLQNQNQSSNTPNPTDQWYYEDPKKNIQGPFSSKDMFNWYRAGFFTSSLMVRRVCDTMMRPLGSYGPVVPFAPNIPSMYPSMSTSYESRNVVPHESMINNQQNLGLNDVMNISNMSNMPENNSMDSMQFGSVGIMRQPNYRQQVVDSLWSQPSPPDMMWMQQTMNSRTENRVNNLPIYFWDQQPSALASNPILPEDLPKEMKTEDQILAQLRLSQNVGGAPAAAAAAAGVPHYMPEVPLPVPLPRPKPDDYHGAGAPASLPLPLPMPLPVAPNLQHLQKLIHEDSIKDLASKTDSLRKEDVKATDENVRNEEEAQAEVTPTKSLQQISTAPETKTKQTKADAEKARSKESTKNKSKKAKEEKREEVFDIKSKEEETSKPEKSSEETSPSKNKKEEKANKKELLKEKKEWLKEGFTIVKAEKASSKDKKKLEEMKAAEEAERKRKEEERILEEERKRKQAEALRKQQELQVQQQQRQAVESVSKKAPWSAVATQSMQTTNKDGLTLTEIQRLEREKKLEQMKEQQQMMQIIAQQQAAALAREQEMQAGLGWAKKKPNIPSTGPSLAEIQAEARKQAAVAAATAAAAAQEDTQPAPPQPTPAPWANTQNGGGFWDTQPTPPQPAPAQMSPKADPPKPKKKAAPAPAVSAKKEQSPAAEFDSWCTTVLASWSAKIDVPTFVGFLKDIESPYEVKDYVKCYLGETKDSSDFARHFLERRSKLLRVGMVTPSDDLCSPAMAVNPRTISGSEYQEVKGKGKKTKKNKMLKVDARILGFSVTAAEDRINVGDIDSV